MTLSGKIAVVTGGASGLGLVISTTLAEAGAKVIVFDRDINKLKELQIQFESELVDVTDEDGLQAAINRVIDKNGRIDILINNAGVIYNEPLINITKAKRRHDYQAYRKIIDINMNSVFLVTSMVAEHMILKRTQGVIVNISSISSEGNAGQTAYSASKAGVNAFTKTWAKELGAFGIRVVAVSPGFIETPSTRENMGSFLLNAILKRIPLRRLGNALDIANTVLTVVCNQYINGTVIDVNGGLVL